ncbi:MAG TPA: hypothetical protein DGZ24_08105 [Rhodospirillaceae bacterium]|nr:hypothetical protein [Candidatus Neomarinimicrobiota bacterium]HCX15265.1 hypothetical protein [Rhodospirillaceae bacterium]
MSDDIPIIFAEDFYDLRSKRVSTAVFLSADSAAQMNQYAVGGWSVAAAPGFVAKSDINLAEVPASTPSEEDIIDCTLLSCEAPHLKSGISERMKRWQPEIIKINCAFYDVADASSLAASLANAGYAVLGAVWRDDNSFGIRSLASLGFLDAIRVLEWDRTNLIGVRDRAHAQNIITVSRLYIGEEKRISELQLAKAVRDDYINKLEDALMAHQRADVFKEPPS